MILIKSVNGYFIMNVNIKKCNHWSIFKMITLIIQNLTLKLILLNFKMKRILMFNKFLINQ